MLKPNAMVSTILRLQPALDGALEALARADESVAVELAGGRRVGLDPTDRRSPAFARVLDGLAREGLPVYLEVDPSTDTIARIIVPHVARVVRITPTTEGFDVELEPSHARHVLRRDDPDAREIEAQLHTAMEQRTPLIVTEEDAHNIIDVRPFEGNTERLLPPFPREVAGEHGMTVAPVFAKMQPPQRELSTTVLSWLRWIIRWPWWPWYWWCCIPTFRAQDAFNAVAATSCDPLTVPAPCIPFLYPDDGCWARAHEMCRLMMNMGLSPRKVWIDASAGHWLHVDTRNNPSCFVDWGWHVAPTLCVRATFPRTQLMVIDPSLFTSPVTEATWKGVQGDPNATLTQTDWTQFWHGGGTDPTFSSTNSILAQYRATLQSRAAQLGPPPYANCP